MIAGTPASNQPTGLPDPGKHVNYTLGMILGVDDFVQEFAYLNGRDQALARELLGYGTISGLQIAIESDARGPRVALSPGVALSPRGQTIRVCAPQCAYLVNWLGDNRREIVERLGSPPGDSVSTYIVLCYRDCIRVGRKTLIGLGAAIVAAAVAAYLVVADPFAGSMPDTWKTRAHPKLGVTLAVPVNYQVTKPEADDTDKNWVTYSDYSGSIWIALNLAKKSEDTSSQISANAAAEMYDDDAEFRESGAYELSMPEGPKTKTDPKETKYQGKKSAENTVTYTTTDSQDPRPRELKIFYYRSEAGDMYKLTISYPGKGDFTARGREVARTAIANLDINEL